MPNSIPVTQYSLSNEKIKTFPSAGEVYKELKIPATSISRVCRENNNAEIAGGFRWEYATREEMFLKFEEDGAKKNTEYPNYFFFPDGRIFGTMRSKFLKPSLDKEQGYLKVSLFDKEDKRKHLSVHRLVAYCFSENNEEKPFVNHKDGITSNPKKDNLEWVTASENTIHAQKNGLQKKFTRGVNQYTKEGELVATYPSINEAAIAMRVKSKTLSDATRGVQKTCRGYVFKYTNPPELASEENGEKWKDVSSVGGYMVSNMGNVCNKRTKRVMKSTARNNGKTHITLGKKSCLLHRIVAEEFVPKVQDKNDVYHIDEDRTNNKAENLEWR